MQSEVLEATYPVTFRQEDSELLGDLLTSLHNVELVGMRRVGISNFLRFFLYNSKAKQKYVGGEEHLFIPVDLNDLVERELFPFWTLTLKRITDTVSSSNASKVVKKQIDGLFLSGIQSHDLFLLIDTIRQALSLLVQQGFLPTLFFIRFDRIKDAANPSFLDNLQGLRDAANRKVSFVFTSYRTLDVLAPDVFPKAATAGFTRVVYIKPAKEADLTHIYESLKGRYTFTLSQELKQELFAAVAGNVQYLQLALILLHEKKQPHMHPEELLTLLGNDERINLQSEELWESLSTEEKELVSKVLTEGKLSLIEEEKASYLCNAGFISKNGETYHLTSPLFSAYVRHKAEDGIAKADIHFTKKEHSLYTLLEEKLGEIVTRDEIIESVWPETKSFGVSDWAIDRLVARVRSKLKFQKSPYGIMTIRTRGYKLQEAS